MDHRFRVRGCRSQQRQLARPAAQIAKTKGYPSGDYRAVIAELKKKGLSDSTLVIITAKHGQSPVDTSRYFRDGSHDPATILAACMFASETGAQIGHFVR